MAEAWHTQGMIRYECAQCEMSATVVDTWAGRQGWYDHMEIHLDPQGYRAWTWQIVPLWPAE